MPLPDNVRNLPGGAPMRINKNRSRIPMLSGRLLSSAALVGFAALLPAAAAESGSAAGTEASATTLETIVVNARKQAEKENDVTISLQAISGARLVERNIGRLEDLTPYVS